MAETHNSWQDTMGDPYQVPENPIYDVSGILRPTTKTPAHAEMFNEIFSRLIINIAAVKLIADGKAGIDIATTDQDGLLSKEDKAAFDKAVQDIDALSNIFGTGVAGGDLQGTYPNPTINPAKLAGIKPAFTQAGSRANIASGDTLAVMLGKIAKMYADLKKVAWSGSYADLSNKPTSFPPSSHTHDDRYYTETEINTKITALNTAINGKAASSHTHTAAQVGAAAASHTHTVAQITNLPVLKSGTWTPEINDAYGECFTNANASGTWYRAGNIVLFWYQTQITRKKSNGANMYCTMPFAGHTFGGLLLAGPGNPTFKKNWLLINKTTGSTWIVIPGGAFAYESQMTVGADYWYYGHGMILL